jgi:hypothetical protein
MPMMKNRKNFTMINKPIKQPIYQHSATMLAEPIAIVSSTPQWMVFEKMHYNAKYCAFNNDPSIEINQGC